MPTPVANGLDLQAARIQNVADPSAAQDAATRAYVDAVARGLDWKQSCRASASGNVTIASPGALIDGVTLAVADRVLLRGQTTASQNGIYTWQGAATPMVRAVDADSDAEVTSGMAVTVTEGTTSGDTVWVLTTNDPIVVGTTALAFAQLGGGGGGGFTVAGLGLTSLGVTVDVGAGVGITVAADSVGIDTAVVPRKFAQAIGDGSSTSIVVTHNLGSTDVQVTLSRVSDGVAIIPDVTARATNTVTLGFAAAPATGSLRVQVQG